MKVITLPNNRKTLVDAADYAALSNWSWHVTRSGNRYYVARNVGRRVFLMHREIMNAPQGTDVDHINGDSLDNRRENLRLATRKQNQANRRLGRNSTSGFKGVSRYDYGRCKGKGLWMASIRINGKKTTLGYFKSKEAAARAYDAAATRHFGEFAKLNFPVD